MEPTKIEFRVPTTWHELSDEQLRYVFTLIASDFTIDEVTLLCLLQWNKVKVIGRGQDNLYLLSKGKIIFSTSAEELAELLSTLDWLSTMPLLPVRLSKIGRHKAVNADFSEVPFETFIMADNLYQGYLATTDDALLDELAALLYGSDRVRPSAAERVSIFYWLTSLKEFFAHRYPDFFQPSADNQNDGNLLGSPKKSVEDAMNAQIRALTKGDVTKEQEVLALDTWRALTELNAQAKEYKHLNSQLNAKK